jgi:hypothetical protein
VRLTPKGVAFEQALEPVVDAAMRHAVIGLDENEEYELLRILDKTVRSMIEVLNVVRRDRRRTRSRRVSPLLDLDDADADEVAASPST